MANWSDYLILAILAVSVLIGLWRGLISEVLALVIWFAAFWVAWTFGPAVAGYFASTISLPSARILVGYGLCFIGVLVAGALVRFVVGRLIETTGLSGTDRLLGMGFGLVRGLLLVTLAVFVLGFTAAPRDPWWRQSLLLPHFTGMAAWLADRTPESVRRYLHPSPAVLDRLPRPALPGGLTAPAPAASMAMPASAT